MASNYFSIKTVNGEIKTYKRDKPQGRIPLGLGKLKKYRLYEKDEKRLEIMKTKLGYLYNENEIVREPVRLYLDNSVGTELLNS